MKTVNDIFILFLVFMFSACEQKIEYVNPTWAQPEQPEKGAVVKIDYFKPDDTQVFSWKARPNSTYKLYFDLDQKFENPTVLDVGARESLTMSNRDFLNMLREMYPEFSSIKRFFWKLEQDTGGEISTSWRYFDAVVSIESFVDPRDGEIYEARQFVMLDGSLMTIMAENLRAKVYADGTELPIPYKGGSRDDEVFNSRVGGYYNWTTAVRMTWEEAKQATLKGEHIQGICPEGWHLPSLAEFDKLRSFLGPSDGANKIKDPTYWHTTEPLTNSARMGVVASGYYWDEHIQGTTLGLGSGNPVAGFWSSTPYLAGLRLAWGENPTEDNMEKATFLSLYDDSQGVHLQGAPIIPGGQNRRYPCRCIMDEF
ncbi:FISUMP domain-containing protein [Proteiniphilum sp. X52]|uniref:FISUMP domain-containing protein n=1 Tax=Proteiniphilum sp. X52 TaxID=2382159 RepID=UPI000F0A5DE5|nr:FISUMP domain-containing protein [Proteiniphilum sp. X52]RNC63662.1 hypothetical protein D7D25_15250 [Proteiniphilum sp. X52]